MYGKAVARWAVHCNRAAPTNATTWNLSLLILHSTALIMTAFRKQKQADLCEFQASQDYIEKSCLEKQNKTKCQKTKNK